MKHIMENWKKFMNEEDSEHNERQALDILRDLATTSASLDRVLAHHNADEATKALVSTALKDFKGEGPGTDIIKTNQKILSGYSLRADEQHKTLSDIDSMEAQAIRKVLPWYWRYAPAAAVFPPPAEEPPV